MSRDLYGFWAVRRSSGVKQMRNVSLLGLSLMAASLGCAQGALAQRPGLEVPILTPGPGWKTCPRCENDAHVMQAREDANIANHPFDPHDISGVWGDMV